MDDLGDNEMDVHVQIFRVRCLTVEILQTIITCAGYSRNERKCGMLMEMFAMEYKDEAFEKVLSEENRRVGVEFTYTGLDQKVHHCYIEGLCKTVVDSMETMAYEKVLPCVKPTSRMFKVKIESVHLK